LHFNIDLNILLIIFELTTKAYKLDNGDKMVTMKSSTEILNELKTASGVQSASIVARDGFVIESVGSMGGEMEIDWLGASLAMVLSGTDKMATHLKLSTFHTITLESNNGLIICYPVGDALLALQAPDSTSIGMIRVQVKKYVPMLAQMF
jgi:predicted regulator of Ras-like GTPase activity (Roadblock/LC7/MglB family)